MNNVFELLKRYWQIQDILPITGDEALLYLYFIEQANIRGWVDTLELSTRTICMRTGMTNKKLCEVRNRLQQKGLIKFEEGNRRKKTPVYRLFGFSEKSKTELKPKSKPKSKQESLYNTKTKDLEEKRTTNVVPKSSVAAKAATLEQRARTFGEELIPFVEVYGKEMIRAFYNHWTEPNRSKTKMRFELEKTWDVSRRLVTWANREPLKKRNNGTTDRYEQKRIDSEQRRAESMANLDAIREAAERRRKELEAEGII
ncbi:hypothetical protein [Bacteroides pyogenes]|uniref:hypothetical protein n=1 Tax=Bacteroides pyogenes TaxID=310300 RepID=UPI00373574DF